MWILLGAIAILAYLIYKYVFSNTGKGYWKQFGILEIDASSAISNWELFRGQKDMTDRDAHAYNVIGNEKFCGMIEGSQKVILIKDLDLLKKVTIKDANHFVDVRDFLECMREDNIFRKMLPILRGDEWKKVRSAVTPVFSSGKIKNTMPLFNMVSKEWVQMIKSKTNVDKPATMNVLDIVNRYTIDVIVLLVFGVNAGTIQDPMSTMAKMANRFGDMNFLKIILGTYFPTLFRTLGIDVIDMAPAAYFESLCTQAIEHRMKGNRSNDFLQLLIDCKIAGQEKGGEEIFTNKMIVAQSLQFFFAGFTTTSQLICFLLYELAAHQDVQENVRDEVSKIMSEDGTVEYDALSDLQYLDMVICETQRMFPAGLRVERMCTENYHDTESGLKILKGTMMVIPINSIHYDSRYYENPSTFDPKRFSAASKAERNSYAYLPFGLGPRSCIGMRFALVQTKAAIAHIVYNFRIEPTSKTPLPPQCVKTGLQCLPSSDLELNFVPLR